jgi:hypothetical protein
MRSGRCYPAVLLTLNFLGNGTVLAAGRGGTDCLLERAKGLYGIDDAHVLLEEAKK